MAAIGLTSLQAKVWLFCTHKRLGLSRDVVKEVCSYFPPLSFSFIYQDVLRTYFPSNRQVTEYRLPVNFSGASCLLLDESTILCIGAHIHTTDVHTVDLPTHQITPLPRLSSPRQHPGLIQIADFVYVFGGFNFLCLTSCEKYDLGNESWRLIGAMSKPRSHFTPCLLNDLVYLVSSTNLTTIETFYPATESFNLLSITYPYQLKDKYSVTFEAKGEICVLTYKQLGRWKEEDRKFRVTATDRYCWSTQQPLIVGSVVLIACQGQVQKFSLETFTFV